MGMGKGVWMMTLQTSSANQIKETRVNSRICSTTSNNKGDGIMDNGNETISISQYNEKLKSVIFNKDLLPKDSSDIKYYYMELLDDEGKLRSISKYHKCSEDYLEYYWVEFVYQDKEYVVSLFYRDFSRKNGDIHVMPGVLQVWEKEIYSEDKKYSFPQMDKENIESFNQEIIMSYSEKCMWQPLIDYDHMSTKCFVWVPFEDVALVKDLICKSFLVSASRIENNGVSIQLKIDTIRSKETTNISKVDNLKKYMVARDNEMLEKMLKDFPNCKKLSYGGGPRGKSNYKPLFRWTTTHDYKNGKYFICPYKHIKTDYGYFIRFDGKPIAYKVKYDSGYPNKLNEKTNCFEIGYDYANAVDVINASKGK